MGKNKLKESDSGDEPPAKKKRVSFAADSSFAQYAERKAAKKDLPKDVVAVFPFGKLKNWRESKVTQHEGRHPYTGARGHPFFAMKSDACENVVFVGLPVTKDKGVDHVIVMQDKKTGKIKTTPGTLANFVPQWHQDVKVLLGDKMEAKKNFKADLSKKEEFSEQRRKLVMEFGSEKKQKTLLDKIAIEQRQEAMSALMATVSNVGKNMEEMNKRLQLTESTPVAQLRTAKSAILPPANMQAKTGREVYDLEDIIPKVEVSKWMSESESFAKMGALGREKLGYGLYIRQLAEQMNDGNASYHAGILLYLDALTKFSRGINEKKNLKVVPLSILTNITDNREIQDLIEKRFLTFEVQKIRNKAIKKYHISTGDKDKMLAHQLVICLILGGFTLESKPFSQFSGFTEPKIDQVARALGCTVDKGKKTMEGNIWGKISLSGPPKPQKKPTKKLGRR